MKFIAVGNSKGIINCYKTSVGLSIQKTDFISNDANILYDSDTKSLQLMNSSEESLHLAIMNNLGQKVVDLQLKEKNAIYQINELNTGVYYLHVYNTKSQLIGKKRIIL